MWGKSAQLWLKKEELRLFYGGGSVGGEFIQFLYELITTLQIIIYTV